MKALEIQTQTHALLATKFSGFTVTQRTIPQEDRPYFRGGKDYIAVNLRSDLDLITSKVWAVCLVYNWKSKYFAVQFTLGDSENDSEIERLINVLRANGYRAIKESVGSKVKHRVFINHTSNWFNAIDYALTSIYPLIANVNEKS